MSKIEASVIINRPAEEIFRFFSMAENHARFIPGMIEVKQTSAGPFAQAGATARGVRRDVIIDSEVRYEITQAEPNKAFGMKGKMGPLHFEDGYVLEPLDTGTRVRFWLEFKLAGLMLLARPFIQFLGKTHAGETLDNLKKVLDGEKVEG
jgi:hypothetical protein